MLRFSVLPRWVVGFLIVAAGIAHAAGDTVPPPALTLDLGGGVALETAFISAGEFTQGSAASEAGRTADESPRRVTLTQGFYIGRTAVTRGQWERFISKTNYRTEAEVGTSGGFGWDGSALTQRKEFNWRNPGFAQTAEHPVCIVTVPDAEAFCRWLSTKTGRGVSVPTEAQWEFACRAGSTTPWHNGAADPAGSEEIAWSKRNAENTTHSAADRKPNAWGLYIGGNVSEWCQDVYAPYPSGPATDPLATTPAAGEKLRRVLRGGSWNRDAKHTRSSARFRADPRSRNADIGFRVTLTADTAPIQATSADGATGALTLNEGHAPSAANSSPAPHTVVPTEVTGAGVRKFMWIAAAMAIFGYLAWWILRAANPSRGLGTSKTRRSPQALATGFAGGYTSNVRLTEDGFLLLLSGVAPRSRVHYEFQLGDGGPPVTGFDVYEPGPQGHYIYTGSTPQSAHVTRVDMPGAEENDSDFDSADDSDDSDSTPPSNSSRRSSGSSHHPSAY